MESPTDRNDQTAQSGSSVGPNRNGPFHLMYQPKCFRIFGLNGKRPWSPVQSPRVKINISYLKDQVMRH